MKKRILIIWICGSLWAVSLCAQTVDTVRIWVDGICGMCEDRIETVSLQTVGVLSADWTEHDRILTVTVDDSFAEDDLHYAVSGVGHDTERFRAADEVYESLYACCKYRELRALEEGSSAAEHQPLISGRIQETTTSNELEPLVGASVYWMGATSGTQTDADGEFQLERSTTTNLLIVSYVGYAPDTIDFADQTRAEIVLSDAVTLDDVEVTYRRKTTSVSFIKPLRVEEISSQELRKAACCNLSESFETNPSVDVSFTDAVTGARQIQLLGLAGPYVQITRELIPDVRSVAAVQGLTYTPGPWIENIQLAKGAGSVSNGYESMTGQINVELKKPEQSERFFLNLYRNAMGRTEANLNWKHQLGERFATGFLVHGSFLNSVNDRNRDNFFDRPTYNNIILINRWQYLGRNGWMGQAGMKYLYVDQLGGQIVPTNPQESRIWRFTNRTDRAEVWAKLGYVLPSRPYASFGSQFNVVWHNQNGAYGGGYRPFEVEQRSAYANLMYQSIIGNTEHQYKTGISWNVERTIQTEEFGCVDGAPYPDFCQRRTTDLYESVPGIFAEYTWLPTDLVTIVAGLRADYHNVFGFFATPRLHLRFATSDRTVIRFSAGGGRRTPRVIAENLGLLASSRRIVTEELSVINFPTYEQEIAWNFGANLSKEWTLSGRALTLGLDVYHTHFQQQLVVDLDEDVRQINVYNLDGSSFSNSAQIQLDYELLRNVDVRLAYRFNDVRTDYISGRLEKPFVSKHRAFINTGYETDSGWLFDATLNWRGSQRIPSTMGNPAEFRLPGRSPDFVLLNGQVSKSWKEKFDVYVGGENLLNYRQESPILAADNPFSQEFDATLIWGPIFGRNIYAGIRWTLK